MNPQVLDIIMGCPSVPMVPRSSGEILRTDVNERDITMYIERHAQLHEQFSTLLGTGLFGNSPTDSAADGVRALGADGARAVVMSLLGFDAVSGFQLGGLQPIGRRAMHSAIGAAAAGSIDGHPRAALAFACALLADIGIVAALNAIGDSYRELIQKAGHLDESIAIAEQNAYGMTHTSIGASLAERWKLQDSLLSAIQYHRLPSAAPSEYRDLVRAAALGASAHGVVVGDVRRDHLHELADRWFGFSGQSTQYVIDQIMHHSAHVAHVLGIDPCTGVRSATGFRAALERTFVRARDDDRTLSIVLVHFGDIADDERPSSDLARTSCGARLCAHFAAQDAAIGYEGGGVFSIALPAAGRVASLRSVERFVREHQSKSSGVHVGTVTVEPQGLQHFENAEQVLCTGYEALAVARSAGTNAVRTYVPRPNAA